MMGKKKSRKMVESDPDLGFDSDMDSVYQNGDQQYHDDVEDVGDEDDELGYDDDGDVPRGEEIEELEEEYRELKNEEQDLLRNLKRQKDEDLQKSQAVKNQRALWDKTLEFRFLLQKSFSSSNRLPQEPARSIFCDAGSGVSEAYSDLVDSSKKTLDSILKLQQALLNNNPSIAHLVEANSMRDSNQLETSSYSNGDIDEEWLQISQMQSRVASFRNKSIDKWQRKTQVTSGAAAIRDRLHAFNQSISQQVAAYMRDPSKMTKAMQQNRSVVAVFGNETHADGDPELLDDSELYQQLLKEFFETIDPSSSEAAFYAMKRLQKKKRKIVDRRASKSRKIRYHVHEKIVNFMAPRRMDLPPMAPTLFDNLFDLKSKKPASVA
ncbi:uncharacterized protein [Henckelia pumila]|uniref:uncharacterized protein isoform X2 n=1 Tax=Henckelia pumila TaxID=405737 RepID=UPI003C6DC43D